ncbi:MAG TPA: hypothetical protein VGC41_04130, partial [Kofleriaceae bacterium]
RFGLHLDLIDELAFHLVHMVRSRLCGPLIQIVDLHRLAQRTNLDAALDRTAEWSLRRGAERAVAYYRSIMAGAPELPFSTLQDVLEGRQPSISRRIAFELAAAESPRQILARAFGAVNQRVFAGRPSGDARGR